MQIRELRKLIDDEEIATTIFSFVMDMPKSSILLLKEIPDTQARRCLAIAGRFRHGIPLAYQFGRWSFYELPLKINRHVLIPRFETEILVAETVKLLKDSNTSPAVLDLCTGSGAVSIAVAVQVPSAKVTGSDISCKAITLARKNARANNADVTFIKSDLFSALRGRVFDIIVCNPPYVRTGDIGRFDVRTMAEPKLALDGGIDGLCFYHKIAQEAPKFLNSRGRILFEIGADQGSAVKKILQQNGFCDIKIIKDLEGRDRVAAAQKGSHA